MSLITPDFGLIFWMTIIFAIVFFILAKFGFPIITGMVEERNKRISASISEAKRAEEELRTFSMRQAQILDECRREQATVIKEAAATRDDIIAKAREQALLAAEKILADAKSEIALEKENALRDIRREVLELSMDVAGEILRENLRDDKAQRALVEKLVNEVSSQKVERL